ncbi:MAG: tRNA-specific adenosine deaminase [Gammaproteobacteria bacterium]|nr:tRNA-specific adenosine deaminase [Gammaproteobacteria bacterium]|tara:strand:+ start:1948 stop:2379 length:432 start_codon:yes stop_codon:yes gene_type:complete
MKHALNCANDALLINEVPVGAVVVRNEIIIGRGYNTVIQDSSISSHAEIKAINEASKFLKNYRLSGCDMYSTLEPCHMCAKAIVDARISNLYFGALEPKTGSVISIDNFLEKPFLNHKVNFSYGHLENDSRDLLQSFFRSKRA